ncbi:MAG TPA: TatD family hydrolase, partial [Clostridia bacterium]|nr:TatD family hydrolase [Clostridia bacterium]
MNYFDTHAHLCDEKFDADREELIASLPGKGIALCVNVACEADEFPVTAAMTKRWPFLYGAYGIHPHVASKPGEGWEEKLRAALADDKAVALGEIGLDYHYDFSEKPDQKRVFVRQLEMAKELGFPVQLHIREAFGDCMEILHAHRDGLRGEMHCYS